MRKPSIIALAFGLCLVMATVIDAEVKYNLDDFVKSSLDLSSLEVGIVSIEDVAHFRSKIRPHFKWKSFELGLDISLYRALEDEDISEELPSIVLRRVAYDYKERLGFEWGRLQKVNFGYGLIMSNYDSGSFGSEEFTNDKAGFLGYLTIGNIGLQGMTTRTNVQAGRVTYTLENTFLPSIIFGGTAVKDTDGISEIHSGLAITREETEILGADVGIPIRGDFFVCFAEFAEIGNRGKGLSAGVQGDIFNRVSYRLEYRKLEADFVPGYFNAQYEATPFSFEMDAPKEDIEGGLALLEVNLLGDAIQSSVQIEKYNERDTLMSAGIGWKQIGNTAGVVNYRENFSDGNDNAILETSVRYFTGSGIDYITHYRRVYLGNGEITETYSLGLSINIKNILSF